MPGTSLMPSGVSDSRKPLMELLWPAGSALRGGLLIVSGAGLLTLSAKINVPLPYVPMTMQSLVVLLIGAAYGWRLGTVTILAYIAEGAMGLPVFAGPVGGLAYMAGPTGGYLAGFVLATFLMGRLSERGWGESVVRLSAAMCIGHGVILASGFAWLVAGLQLGATKALLVGVVPFLAGSAVKSALGAVLLAFLNQRADRSR